MTRVLAALPLGLLLASAAAAQSPPPVPRDFVTDEAGILPPEAEHICKRLHCFL
jgi:hypothetical protein